MRGFILNMIMVFVGFYLTVTGMFLSMESFKRNTIILTMIESAKIASVVNLDDSARVEENYVDVIDMTFEENFEKLFYKNLNIDNVNKLSDIAPFVLNYMNLNLPDEMK